MTEPADNLLLDMADRLFGDLCAPQRLADAEDGVWPAAAWQAVADAGLPHALVPEAAGGVGVPVGDAFALLRVAGHHALPLPLAETMLAGRLLAGAGLAIPEGGGALSIAPVIPDGGRLHATREGGGAWRFTGKLPRVPWGRNVDAVVTVADIGSRTCAALIPRSGFTVEAGENIAREPRDDLTVDVRLSEDAVGVSEIAPDQLLAIGAAMRCCQMAGALERVLGMTVQYAQDRVQFGRPLGKFQAVQQNLAALAGQVAAARAAADLAAEAVAAGSGGEPSAIACAKIRAGEAAGVAPGIAHQIHGALGFTYEHSLHFFTKRLWAWREEFGNEEHWSLRLGRCMLAAGADALWPSVTAV